MGGLYIGVHFAVRWNIQIRLVERKKLFHPSSPSLSERNIFLSSC